MKKIFILGSILICLFSLIGCANNALQKKTNLSELFQIPKSSFTTNVKKLSVDGYEYSYKKQGVVLFKKDNKYVIYNSETDQSKTIQLYSTERVDIYDTYYAISNKEKTTTYSHTFKRLKEYSISDVYQMKDDVVTVKTTTSLKDDYYYDNKVHSQPKTSKKRAIENGNYSYEYTGTGLIIYKGDIEYATFVNPSDANYFQSFILANGDVVYQYTFPTSGAYDYIVSDQKFKLKTFLFQTKIKKTKEIQLNYILYNVDNKLVDDGEFVSEKLEYKNNKVNLVMAYNIVDKYLDRFNLLWLVTDNKLKIKSSINHGSTDFYNLRIVDKKTAIFDTLTEINITDLKGKIKKTYLKSSWCYENAKYLVTKDPLDMKKHIIYHFSSGEETRGYKVISNTSDMLLLEKKELENTKYYVHKKGKVEELENKAFSFGEAIYYTSYFDENTGSNRYNLYTEAGVFATKVEDYRSVAIYDNLETRITYQIVMTRKNNMIQYYRLVMANNNF